MKCSVCNCDIFLDGNCPCTIGRDKVILTELGDGYALKYDGIRKENRWTALSPSGRIGGDVATSFEVMQRILDHKGKSDA